MADDAEVVVEGEGGYASETALLAVLFTAGDLAVSVDGQFERLSALGALVAVGVVEAAEDQFDAGPVDKFIALGTAGADIVDWLDAALG